jgi:hypothetical protein
LNIICDSGISPITLSAAAAVSVDYFNSPTGSTTTVYSHLVCGPPTFTIVDANGNN